MANRLAKETSPYLLQHAQNPVDWYPWGEEAFERALAEDKPVLVSIGYAACHWCHVMERESFENEEVAALMNAHFINIKVDREERPDVDHVYMDAVQAISGTGGWPLNIFLTPDKRPFYGGTYFPPKRTFNRSSWTEVLMAVARSFKEKREEIDQQANNLTEHLNASNLIGIKTSMGTFSEKRMDEAYQNIMKTADKEWGGFGRAPKFPQSFTINFLLTFGHLTGSEEALRQALLSLDKMIQGGIYDQVGGGFARYSTDTEWLVPHFEKMLYDNALLVSTMADALALTGSEVYRQTIGETLAFVEREMMHPDGGFYSALDADSEGEEGKFYVWDHEEVIRILGEEATIFCDYYGIAPGGNWEGKNIPWVRMPMKEFAVKHGLDKELLAQLLVDGKEKLLAEREKRVRPQLDDKVLLNWNALMNSAYSKAYAVTGNVHYKELAIRNMQFLLTAFGQDRGDLHHSWKEGVARHPPFLDDYAFLICALIDLAEASADWNYLDMAAAYTDVVIGKYGDLASPLFFYTAEMQKDILIRKKEIYDGATPAGNSVMASNLFKLAILLDKPAWKERVEEMVKTMGELSIKYPTSFGVWLSLVFEMVKGISEIAIVGAEFAQRLSEVQKIYLPHKIIMAAAEENDRFPLLKSRKSASRTHIFLCRNYVCQQPVSTLSDLLYLLGTK